MRLHPLRKLIILATLLLTASTLLVTPVASAQGPARDFGSEAGFLSSLNSQRAAGGLAPLALSSSMTAAADSWAFAMANGSFLAHASDIVSGTPGGWTKVGENVGRGQTVSSLTSAFMSSPGHRANIMDASYTHIGIAVYTHPSDGRIYTTHRFAALPGAAPVVAAPVVAPTVAPLPTATAVPPTPVPPTPVPPTPVPPTPVPPTPVPVQPTAVPATPVPTSTPAPTATPIPPLVTTPEPDPTAIPATPVPTEIPATPVPTEIPATPEPTAVPPTPVPAAEEPEAPTATPEPIAADSNDFGEAPEQLAFVDNAAIEAQAQAKLASKTAKFGR